MVSQRMKELGTARSVIRELFEYGKVRAAEVGAENVFDFSLGTPSVPAPAAVNETAIRLLQEQPDLIHAYTSAQGAADARERFAASLNRRFGTGYTPDRLYLTVGAAASLCCVFNGLTCPGDEFVVFAPYFTEYKVFIEGAGARMTLIPPEIEGFQIDFETFERAINEHTKGVVINTPNNPSGVVYSRATLERLAAVLTEKSKQYGHPIYLISDEPYREILYPGADCGYTASLYDNTITCYSFSKSLSLPGERIGYLAVCPKAEEAERIIELCPQISRTIGHNGAATLMQHTVAKCLEETSDLTVYQRNRDRLYQALTEYGYSCVKPDGTFYLFPQSLENDAYAFCARAQELDLLFVPGDVFGCPGHFRIAYCVPEEKVNRALPRLKQLAEIYQRK